ncbi:TPA: trypsin-like peptidase domain-containing protein [Candidatus Woesearchaeota archaeon]|nr:trypsin-like peptidase domain-containing protein [Candidatus Woesearchaeota archaeon]
MGFLRSAGLTLASTILATSLGLDAQAASAKVAHLPPHPVKTPLERMADQTLLIKTEGTYKSIDETLVSSEGTVLAYKRDDRFTYFITNYHVIQPTLIDFKNEKYRLKLSFEPTTMRYSLLDNGIEYGQKGDACVLYADKKLDVAVVYAENSELAKNGVSFTQVKPLMRPMHLGEQVTMVGYPLAVLQQAMTGIVSSRGTYNSSSDENPVPGYNLDIMNNGGVSGSGVFVQQGTEIYWAGIAQSAYTNLRVLQMVPVTSFYDRIKDLTAPSCGCAKEGQTTAEIPSEGLTVPVNCPPKEKAE